MLGIPESNLVWTLLNKGAHEEPDRDDFDIVHVETVLTVLSTSTRWSPDRAADVAGTGRSRTRARALKFGRGANEQDIDPLTHHGNRPVDRRSVALGNVAPPTRAATWAAHARSNCSISMNSCPLSALQ